MDSGRDGAGPTETGLRRERSRGAPLRDETFDAIQTDVEAGGDDGLGRPLLDGLDDALAEIGRICFHVFTIAPFLYLCKPL